jgi:hypothetical protein
MGSQLESTQPEFERVSRMGSWGLALQCPNRMKGMSFLSKNDAIYVVQELITSACAAGNVSHRGSFYGPRPQTGQDKIP